MVVTTEGLVFYASSTIKEYLGFHQVRCSLCHSNHTLLYKKSATFQGMESVIGIILHLLLMRFCLFLTVGCGAPKCV